MSGLCSEGGSNLFALVAYLPEPLAGFVNQLRRELSPGCRLRAHITLLPPRALACDAGAASAELRAALEKVRAVHIEAQGITVFPVSHVVYLSLGAGREQLKELHAELNHGKCQSSEVWCFEPHVTLAQDLKPEAVAEAVEISQKRWREYTGPRDFTVDNLTLVKSTGGKDQGAVENCWVDLATWELPSPVLA